MPRPRPIPLPPRKEPDLSDPPVDGWWEWGDGATRVWVRAGSAEEARVRAEAQLRDLGLLPGGRPELHESFRRMREFALRGRRR